MFNVDSNGNAELIYDQSYEGFFMVKYGLNASTVDANLCQISGVTDYFPPSSSDGSIIYRTFETLEHYLGNRANVDPLMTSDFAFKDPFKQLLWDLGQVAITCKTKEIELDTRIDRVFVAGNDSPRVKAIACVVGDNTNNWLNNLVGLYDKVKDACHNHYPKQNRKDDKKFINFLSSLKNSSSLRAAHTVFQSYYFWSSHTKLRLIDKLDDMTDCHKTMFVKAVQGDLPLLLTWRSVMLRDQYIGPLYSRSQRYFNNLPDPKVDVYNAKEVDFLLKFLRSNIAHFRKLVLRHTTQFNDELDLVEYYDDAFPEIMAVVFKGCKIMKSSGKYEFDSI